MNWSQILEHMQCEVGIAAVADFNDGGGSTDIINMKNHAAVLFLVHWGVGATGTTTITVDACDDVSASTTSAVPFTYKINKAGTHGAATVVAATGVLSIAGSNQVIAILVTAE